MKLLENIQQQYRQCTLRVFKSILNVFQKDGSYSLFALLGYLNSKLVSFYHKRQTVKGNRKLFPKVVVKDLQNYPFVIDQITETKIKELVAQILTEKQKDASADTNGLEKKIDDLVYNLYELTEGEIEIIEKA